MPGFQKKLFPSVARSISSVVIAEHDGHVLNAGTLSTITAAKKLGGTVSLIVAGKNLTSVADAAASTEGVSRILVLDSDYLANNLAENLAKALLEPVKEFTHVLTPSSNQGKNFLPRLAALLNSSPLSDISGVVDSETFVRPMYAGNSIATVKMTDAIKVLS